MSQLLTGNDQKHFRDWIELNLSSISWEGRYQSEFDSFWQNVFKDNIEVSEQFLKLNSILDELNEGPIISWIKWIREKLICYVFVYKNYEIKEISRFARVDSREVSLICRDFFIERFPHLEEDLNERFQIGNKLSKNLNTKFSILKNDFDLPNSIRGSVENEILTGLEVTLYSEWNKLKDSLNAQNNSVDHVKSDKVKKGKKQTFRFLSELMLLFLLGALLIAGIKFGNNFYENYLIKNISLFEPNFLKLEKNLSFKSEGTLQEGDISISMDELDALEKIESKKVFEDSKQVNRYEVESDVVLTSVDSLPKDFDIADLEQSTYEEVKKGGYRNNRYGRRKAYRVMMTSVDANHTKKQLDKILKNFEVKQVDNVKPGTKIPGGIYFNLYIPRTSLKNFLSKVSSLEQSTILESKTSFGGPAGTDKVFIWIKSI